MAQLCKRSYVQTKITTQSYCVKESEVIVLPILLLKSVTACPIYTFTLECSVFQLHQCIYKLHMG